MPTNDLVVNLYDKKLLSLTGINAYFLTYLSDKIDERTSAIFQQTSGVLDGDEIEIVVSGNDEFDLDITNASRVVVGTGQIIDLSRLNGPGLTTDIPIENAIGVTYYVGIKFMQIADGIEVNPRSADPEYPTLRDSYGELDTPTSLVDNFGVDLTININSITESGVDHSGRSVKVYLVDPVSAVEATAYFVGTSVYNAPNNQVVIPYSGGNGPLGQDTSVNPPSTTPADYVVSIEGVTWRRNTDLRTDSDYAFLGTIIGGGAGNPIGVIDLSDQNPIFINTLDRAYDGATGAGSGRLIFVDGEAVELRSRAGNTDELGASLRIDRKSDSEDGSSALQTIADQINGDTANQIHLVSLTHVAGNLSVDNPATSVNPDIVAKTGAVDWSASGISIYMDLAWLQNFSTIDGLYQIYTAPGVTNMGLRNLDGSVPAFPGGETGNVTVLRMMMRTSPTAWGNTVPYFGRGGTIIHGPNEDLSPPTVDGGDATWAGLSLYNTVSDNLVVYDGEAPSSPRAITWINRAGILKTVNGIVIAPQTGLATNKIGGLKQTAAGHHVAGTPLDWIPSGVDVLGFMQDPSGVISEYTEPSGRRATPHRFIDDFHYHENKWTSAATAPIEYDAQVSSGNAQVYMNGSGVALDDWAHGGVVILQCDNASLDTATLSGPFNWWIDPAEFLIGFFARFCMNYNPTLDTDRVTHVGMRNTTFVVKITFEMDFNVHGNTNYWIVCTSGANTKKADTGFGPQFDGSNNPQFSNFQWQVTGAQSIRYQTGDMSAPATLDLSTAIPAAIDLTLSANKLFAPDVLIGNGDTQLHRFFLDRWEASDQQAISIPIPGNQVY